MSNFLIGALLWLVTVSLLPGAWTSDFEAALKTAKAENKDLYLVFVSTDSSGACQQLEKRILSSEKFQTVAQEKFVLVKVDLPLKKRLQKESHASLLALAKRFGVGEVFPTAIYLDSTGRPFHQENGVMPGGPEEYAGHLRDSLGRREKRDRGFKEASKLSGIEKAQALIGIMNELPDKALLNFYSGQMEELARLDPDDTLKFRQEKVVGQAYAEFEDSVKMVFHKDSYDKVVGLVDAFLEKYQPEGELRQKVLFRKLAALNHGGSLAPAIKVADEILAIDKESAHGRFAAQIKERIEKRLGK